VRNGRRGTGSRPRSRNQEGAPRLRYRRHGAAGRRDQQMTPKGVPQGTAEAVWIVPHHLDSMSGGRTRRVVSLVPFRAAEDKMLDEAQGARMPPGMGWPFRQETWCPWCEETVRALPRRWRSDAGEFECPECQRWHTRKPDDPGIYVFYSADIEAAISDEV